MSWFSGLIAATLIGIGSNLDNSGVGIAYGAERIRLPHWVNAIINGVGGMTAVAGAVAGLMISRYISAGACSWMSCMCLCGIGLVILYMAYLRPVLSKGPHSATLPAPGWRQGIFLGLALSFSNITCCFGATVGHVSSVWETVLSITVWGYVMTWLGNVLGIGAIAKVLGKYGSLFSGILLMIVGVHQLY